MTYYSKRHLGFWYETVAAHYILDKCLSVGFNVEIHGETTIPGISTIRLTEPVEPIPSTPN